MSWKNIMKAYPFEEKRLSTWQPPYIIQPKYDGVRCRAVKVNNGATILLSSEENIYFSVPHINEELDKLSFTELDGELYHHGMTFEEIFSITSRSQNLHPDYKRIQFHCFDIVNEKPQFERILEIERLKQLNLKTVVVAPFWIAQTFEEVMKTYNELISFGYEGMIIRHFQCPYERKRSRFVMKFKPKKKDAYEIISYGEELSINGVPKNRLGFLVCQSGDGNLFNVGSGFTERQRIELWERRDELPGKTAIVEYQHITPGRKVPRFPVFVKIV